MDEKLFALPQSSKGGNENTLAVSPNAGGTTVAPPLPSGVEAAGRLFAEEVGRLPGVLRVEQWGQERSDARGASGAPTFHVYLRPDDRDTEYAIYEAKGQVYDRYPKAYLDVVVLEAIDGPPPNGEPSV